MGGKGTGAWQHANAKRTCEECINLNIIKLRRQGLIKPEWCSRGTMHLGKHSLNYEINGSSLTLHYILRSVSQAQRKVSCQIKIISTPQHNGGHQFFWQCPQCGRRCGCLYLAPGRSHFLCRLCAALVHQSTRRPSRAEMERKQQEELRRRQERLDGYWIGIEQMARKYGPLD